jgi:hypothetical protein
VSSRKGFASIIAAAKSQAAVTGLLAQPQSVVPAESGEAESTPLVAVEPSSPEVTAVAEAAPPAIPQVRTRTKPAQPTNRSAPSPEPLREHGRPDAISWVADLTAARQGDWLIVYGVPVPLPKGTDEEPVTMSFRCPRWLREAVHMRCRQYDVEVQEFGQAALAVVLAQLQATDQQSS